MDETHNDRPPMESPPSVPRDEQYDRFMEQWNPNKHTEPTQSELESVLAIFPQLLPLAFGLDRGSLFSLSIASRSLYFYVWQHGVTSLNFRRKSDVQQHYLGRKPNLLYLRVDKETHPFTYLLSLKSLTYLSLIRCEKLVESALQCLSELKNLQSLNLRDGSGVTTKGMRHLTSLQKLTYLNLRSTKEVTDDCILTLTTLTQLQYLNLRYSRSITINGINHLPHFQQLTRLNLRHCRIINDSSCIAIGHLTNLTYLNLHFCDNITDRFSDHLAGLNKLMYLSVFFCDHLTDYSLKRFQVFHPELTFLDLGQCTGLSDEGVECLAHLTKMKILVLSHIQLTSTGLAPLTTLQNLCSLSINACRKLQHSSFFPLKSLSNLEVLNMNTVGSTDFDFITSLTKLTSLQAARLSNLKDRDLHHFKDLTGLVALSLSDNKEISDGCIPYLTHLTKLKVISLDGTCVSPKGRESVTNILKIKKS